MSTDEYNAKVAAWLEAVAEENEKRGRGTFREVRHQYEARSMVLLQVANEMRIPGWKP